MAEEDWIRYGEENENNAIAAFERKTGKRIRQQDLKCSFEVGGKTFNGKIDGHVIGENAIVEVKCPISARSDYLGRNASGEWVLLDNPPWQYYHQIQAYMEALNKDLCYFIDYRPNDELIIVKVERNRNFFAKVKTALESYT